eukprot:SAG22_NODE_1700_length_3778_cov_13.973362_3_plen_40_part_01
MDGVDRLSGIAGMGGAAASFEAAACAGALAAYMKLGCDSG